MLTSQIDKSTLVILAILFLVFVVGDLLTTIWLINNYPGGIEGESNPWGALLFSSKGIVAMIFVKITLFMILSASVIMMEYFYKHDKKIMRISHCNNWTYWMVINYSDS